MRKYWTAFLALIEKAFSDPRQNLKPYEPCKTDQEAWARDNKALRGDFEKVLGDLDRAREKVLKTDK